MNPIYQMLRAQLERGRKMEVEQACLEILTELKSIKPCYNQKEISRQQLNAMSDEQRESYRKNLERQMLNDLAQFLTDNDVLTIREVESYSSEIMALRAHLWIVDSQFDGDVE